MGGLSLSRTSNAKAKFEGFSPFSHDELNNKYMFGWVNRAILLYNLLAMGMLYPLGHFRQWRVWFQDTIITESCECHWPSNLIFHFHKHLCQFILHWGSLNWGNESEYVRQGWPLFGCVSYTEVNVMCKMMQITALTATSLYFPPLQRLLFPLSLCSALFWAFGCICDIWWKVPLCVFRQAFDTLIYGVCGLLLWYLSYE